MARTTLAAAAAITIVLGLAGCGDDGDASGTATTEEIRGGGLPTSTMAPDDGVPEAAVEYVEALATGTVTSIGRMAELAAPGSPAELYARYHLASARYWGGGPPSTTEVRDDEIEVCDDDLAAGEPTCTVFGAFEVDADGLLVTFSTDGSPIDDRLRAGDPAGVGTEGVSVVVLTSYLTSRGDLVVVVDVTNNRGEVIEVDDCSATYVGPDGRQVTQQCGSMLPQVQPGATTSVAYVFEQVAQGGTMTLTVFADPQGSIEMFDVQVPVP